MDIDVEIFAVGRWNGMDFDIADLMDFAISFSKLKEVHKVPLKMGHNDEQPFTDGQPALGWVDDVWVDKPAGKLMAKFIDVPDIVGAAIEKGLYKHVSIEADFGVEHSGSFYSNVLSGVALLGADIPAVNTLQDLRTYMSKEGAGAYKFTKRQVFTFKQEDSDMAISKEDMEARLEAERARLRSDFAREQKLKDDELAAEKAKNEKFAADQKVAEFTRNKGDFTAELEQLVKDKKMLPAQRDKIAASVTDEASLASAKFAAEMFKDVKPMNIDEDESGKGNNGDAGTGYKDASEELDKRARKFSREKGVDYCSAVEAVMEDDADLARAYINMTGV